MIEQPEQRFAGMAPLRSCSWCQAGEAAWVRSLDWERLKYRIYGKGYTMSSPIMMCQRCESLYRAGADDELVAVHPRTWERNAQDIEESTRKPLAVIRAADLGVISIEQWLPPGVAELEREGFAPIEELTGDETVVRVWPEQHRRAVPETRPEHLDYAEDGLLWLVRSPWPSLPLLEVVRLMWHYVDDVMPLRAAGQGARKVTADERQLRSDAVAEFLRSDEATILELQRAHPDLSDPQHPELDENQLTVIRLELDQLLREHAARIEQRRTELAGQPRTDLFVVVPHRFEPCVEGLAFQGLPVMTDLIDVPEVRAYRRLLGFRAYRRAAGSLMSAA